MFENDNFFRSFFFFFIDDDVTLYPLFLSVCRDFATQRLSTNSINLSESALTYFPAFNANTFIASSKNHGVGSLGTYFSIVALLLSKRSESESGFKRLCP